VAVIEIEFTVPVLIFVIMTAEVALREPTGWDEKRLRILGFV
jgi:hypothetical protein